MPKISQGREAQHESPQFSRYKEARPYGAQILKASSAGTIAPKNPLPGVHGSDAADAFFGSVGEGGRPFDGGQGTPDTIGGIKVNGKGRPSAPDKGDGSNPGGSPVSSWRRPSPGSAQSGPEWEINMPSYTGPNVVSSGQIAPNATGGLGILRPDDHKPDVVGKRVAKWGPGGAPRVSSGANVFDPFGRRGPGGPVVWSTLDSRLRPEGRVTDDSSDAEKKKQQEQEEWRKGQAERDKKAREFDQAQERRRAEAAKKAADAAIQQNRDEFIADVKAGANEGVYWGTLYGVVAGGAAAFVVPEGGPAEEQAAVISGALNGALYGGIAGGLGHIVGLHWGHRDNIPSEDGTGSGGPGSPRWSTYRPSDDGSSGTGPGSPRLRSARANLRLGRDVIPSPEDAGGGTPRSSVYRPNPEDSGPGNPRSSTLRTG